MEIERFQKLYIIASIVLLLFLACAMYYVYQNKKYITEDPMKFALRKKFKNTNTTCFCTSIDENGKRQYSSFSNNMDKYNTHPTGGF